MKVVNSNIKLALVLVIGLFLSLGISAQVETLEKENEKIAKVEKPSNSDDRQTVAKPTAVSDDDEKRDDDTTELVRQYKSYLSEYLLGPQDVISIEVFGQCPDYCRTNIAVPPTAVVQFQLVRDGIFVGGKTSLEVADDVTKKLDEYIIDPKVTVTLVKAGSARYAVMGKVMVPGERIMDRAVSLYDAVLGAGGVIKGGDKKKVILARINPQGFLERQSVNLNDIERGKIPTPMLRPGDQVIVPGKGFTWQKFLNVVTQIGGVRGLIGGPL